MVLQFTPRPDSRAAGSKDVGERPAADVIAFPVTPEVLIRNADRAANQARADESTGTS